MRFVERAISAPEDDKGLDLSSEPGPGLSEEPEVARESAGLVAALAAL
jgi:hypothetical protein